MTNNSSKTIREEFLQEYKFPYLHIPIEALDDIADFFLSRFNSLQEEKIEKIRQMRISYFKADNENIQQNYERALVNKTIDQVLQILEETK